MAVDPGSTLTKHRTAQLVYQFDWSDYLVGSAEIDTYTLDIDGPDGVLTQDEDSDDGEIVTFRLLAGTAGKTYKISCTITTNEDPTQTDPRWFFLKVE